jgi:hypothetical protein
LTTKKLGKYLKNKTIGETHYEQEDSHLIMMEYYKGQRGLSTFNPHKVGPERTSGLKTWLFK